jgi:hypothetical protein
MKPLFHSVLLFVAVVLASCGGGGSTPAPDPIQGVSPGGIWHGTDSATGLAITGLVDETGSADFMRADNAVFDGQVSTSGSNSISVDAQGYAQKFPDGSQHGIWTVNGTIQERQSITATNALRTDSGTSTHGTLDLTFDALYNRPSSLATVAGSYTISGRCSYLSIGSDGGIGGHICTVADISGQISVINPAYNLYRVHLTVISHAGSSDDVDGLATMQNTASPSLLVIGVATSSAGTFPDVEKWCTSGSVC